MVNTYLMLNISKKTSARLLIYPNEGKGEETFLDKLEKLLLTFLLGS